MRTALLRKFITLAGLCLATLPSEAATIVWTNSAGGSWDIAENWNPNLVPTLADDVLISLGGDYLVTAASNTGAKSLTLGGTTGRQSLLLDQITFTLAGPAQVGSNGELRQSGGCLAGNKQVTLDGVMRWSGGTNAVKVNISTNALLDIFGGNTKYFNNATVMNYGTVNWRDAGWQVYLGTVVFDNYGIYNAVATTAAGCPIVAKIKLTNYGTVNAVTTDAMLHEWAHAVTWSNKGILNYAELTSFTKQPVSQQVVTGDNATLRVEVTGDSPLFYQWFRNGAIVAGAIGRELKLDNVQPEQAGLYFATVSNVIHVVTSSNALLVVDIPPVIVLQPVSWTANEGQASSVSVVATGSQLTYQWRQDNQLMVGATNATLFFPSITALDGGKYKADIFSGIAKVTSEEAELTVILKPRILESPQSKNVNAGSDLTLSLRASGTAPFGYLWVKDGVAVPGGTNESLTLRSMSASLTGSYVVIVANEAGYEISQPAVIQLNAPPQITTQPVSQSATVGSNVVFSVTATGVPAPTYQWRKNGLTIPGASSPSLFLAGVQPKDAGRYTVVAANSFGTMESAPAELTVEVPSLPFANHFADRGVIYTASGYGRGTNFGATKEVGEPRHAGKASATNSVWISWWAPANGIVTFSTEGSDFDTVLAVYQGTAVNGLTKVAEDDDSAGYHNAKVSFNAQAGTYYQIAVAGYNGMLGDIILSWDLLITVELLPRITQAPLDYTGNTNETVGLQVLFEAFQATAIQWFFRGQAILGATQSSLTISNLQSDKVGGYAVRLTASTGRTVVSPPGDVQINTLGYHNVAARNKLADALDWAQLNGGGGVGLASPNKTTKVTLASGAGPARGYNGTQIFNTQGADRDAGEPNHCGVPGGASSWFVYQAPTNGMLVIDTDGSTFDTVLEVYTGNGTDFQSLTSVACDNNSGADGLDSRVIFPATGGAVYYIVVDGVDGASGTVVLNYALGQAPTISSQPQSRTAPLGGSVTVSVSATGIPAPAYQWTFNGSNISGATNASLTLTDFQSEWVGRYQVEVSNALGTVMSTNANLYLDGPLRLANCSVPASGCFGLQVIGPANTTYVIQASTNLVNWLPLATNAAPLGLWNFIDSTATNGPARFYRVLPAP